MNANQAAERLYGWPLAEMQGRVAPSMLPDDEESREHMQRVLRGEIIMGAELPQQRRDGSIFEAAISGAPLRDAHGKTRGFVALGEDITERKKAAAALHTQVRVLASMIEGVVVTDNHGQIIYSNPAFDKMFGYESGELQGRHCSSLNACSRADNQALFKELIQEICDTGVWRGEFYNRRKDGSTFYTAAHLSALQLNDKKLYIAVEEDITERKQVTEALQESEARYRSLFQNNHAVMLLIEPETAAIVDANPAAGTYYGYAPEELTAMKMTEINTQPLKQLRQEMRQACSGEKQQFFFQHRLAGGEVREVEIFTGPIQVQGKKLLYSIVHDITERRQAEEELRLSMKRLNLLAGIASELLASPVPEQLLDDISQKIIDFLHCDMYLSFMADEEAERLHLNAYGGIGDERGRPDQADRLRRRGLRVHRAGAPAGGGGRYPGKPGPADAVAQEKGLAGVRLPPAPGGGTGGGHPGVRHPTPEPV